MKTLCRCKPCTSGQQGCCCWGECGPSESLAEPCCEGCIPCCTGEWVCNYCLIPCCFPLMSCGCGCCASEKHGGLGVPGIPGFKCQMCCSYKCCRNGLHREHRGCTCCWCIPCNCTCNSTCCSCCRAKFHDRRRFDVLPLIMAHVLHVCIYSSPFLHPRSVSLLLAFSSSPFHTGGRQPRGNGCESASRG